MSRGFKLIFPVIVVALTTIMYLEVPNAGNVFLLPQADRDMILGMLAVPSFIVSIFPFLFHGIDNHDS